MSKPVWKKVNFEFFEVCLEYNEDLLKDHLKEVSKSLEKTKGGEKRALLVKKKEIENLLKKCGDCSERYDLSKLIDKIRNGNVSESQVISNKLIELDKNSILPNTSDEIDAIFFQLSNNREVNIPSKKSVGKERKDIELNDDEYIGEFMSILFNKNLATAMVQINKYALNIRQLMMYFNQIRSELFKIKGIDHDGKIIRFIPMMDENVIDKMQNSEYFTKIHIRGSDVALKALPSQKDSGIYGLKKVLSTFKGVNIDVTVSVNTRSKTGDPLDTTEIKDIYNAFQKMNDDLRPQIETSFKEDENGKTEVANWLIPKMNEQISFLFEPRKTIGYELVYEKMREAFDGKLGRISVYHAKKAEPR